ncbi:AAA family ATPase [Rathayibacter sp. VKM Ac-2857]|uniref:AAA family ATPase n=1 Tax=Rathayibacter sp. VKM Ac-2857 TaxID=2739020 RepID=UPI0015647B35|nr:AAA family ATPase [Rathayibacter sp. VKM Ac-2857]NQX18295.1 AAA family ATPase [Rathayibacter sp. VKM Ac-2857]
MPFALVVVGSAGSGKSTVARELARRCTAAYLDKDALAGPLVEAALAGGGHSPDGRENSAFYLEHVMPAEYAALFAVAADNLRLGLSVVLDAPFAAYLDQPGFLEEAARTADWPSVTTTVLRVVTSEAETRRRLESRGLDRDLVKLAEWDAFWTRWGRSPLAWTGADVLELDNSATADLEPVVARLLAGPAGTPDPAALDSAPLDV